MGRPSFVRFAWVLPLLAVPASADVQVALREGRVDVAARSAPLSEVLDRLARQTNMQVTYEGAPPRQLVTAFVQSASPAQAVLAVLEGLGVNYALQLDATGQQVKSLLMIAPKGGSASARPAPDAPAARMPPPAAEDEETAIVDEDDPPGSPADMRDRPDRFRPGRDRMERPPGGFDPAAQTPAPSVVVPAVPTPAYPVSPFAPVVPPPIQQATPPPAKEPAPHSQPDED